jgi:cell division protein FtsB
VNIIEGFNLVLATGGLSMFGWQDVVTFVSGGGVAWYLFKLYRKGNESQIQELKARIDELEATIAKLNEDYIEEVAKRATAEAENKELRRTIKRLDEENKKLKGDDTKG